MSFVIWHKEFDELVKPIVFQRRVWDLGSGTKAPMLPIVQRLGCAKVQLVDKDTVIPPVMPHGFGVDVRQHTLFRELLQDFKKFNTIESNDIALLAWPPNSGADGLADLMQWFNYVIYIGCNSGGTACGDLDLWNHFTTREVVHYLPRRKNSLIVYGTMNYHRRALIQEEAWALDHAQFHPFEDHSKIIRGLKK
jgi:hypothetical protein